MKFCLVCICEYTKRRQIIHYKRLVVYCILYFNKVIFLKPPTFSLKEIMAMNIYAENYIQRIRACMYATWENLFPVELLLLEKYGALPPSPQNYSSKTCVMFSSPGKDVIHSRHPSSSVRLRHDLPPQSYVRRKAWHIPGK